MPTEIYMVKLGMTMTEGTVAEWHVPDGGEVKAGEDLYRLETEKVEMEVEAEATGTVRHLVPDEATVDPGVVVGYIYAAGEEIPEALPGAGAPAASADATPAPARHVRGLGRRAVHRAAGPRRRVVPLRHAGRRHGLRPDGVGRAVGRDRPGGRRTLHRQAVGE